MARFRNSRRKTGESASHSPISPDASPWGRMKTRLTPTPSTPGGMGPRHKSGRRRAEAAPDRRIAARRRRDRNPCRRGVFIAVPLVVESGRPVKANTLDAGLLDAIDSPPKKPA